MKFKKNWLDLLPYKSKLSNIKDINQKNKKFESLSLPDQRKEIALDVLMLINNESIFSSNGSYIESDDVNIGIFDSEQAFKSFNDNQYLKENDCRVCARGAMMLSTIRLGNTISPEFDCDFDCGSIENQKYFTLGEFLEMEEIYENRNRFNYRHNTIEMLANIFLNVIYETDLTNRKKYKDYLKNIII